MKENNWFRTHAHCILLILILGVGLLARVYRFGILPGGGMNQDEVYAGYEAYSLLKTGCDSYGYPFPVYLTTWGSGMNVLESYLMIPFIAIFGLHTWVIRLPQLLVGCLSIPAVYLLASRLSDRRTGLFSAFLLAIAPWHIMLSRWGLESNLLPGFLLFGLLFFAMGLERPRCLMLSALMYGLSLYCYAIIWPILPLILILQFVLARRLGKLRWSRELGCSIAILFVLALPLMLFCCVNYFGMEEIRLPFLSIPKLAWMHTEDFHDSLRSRLIKLIKLLLYQSDGATWNSVGKHGIFYRFSNLFFLVGLALILIRSFKALRKREALPPIALLCPQMALGLLTGILYPAITNRQNCLFIPMIVTTAYGIVELCRGLFASRRWRALILVPVAAYLCAFCGFERDYIVKYPQTLSDAIPGGLEEATHCALELDSEEIHAVNMPVESKPRIMFFAQIDPQEFQSTARYRSGEPRSATSLIQFGKFHFDEDLDHPNRRYVYLLGKEDSMTAEKLADEGFHLKWYNAFCVVWNGES